MVYDAERFTNDLNDVLKEVRTLLIQKNKSYNDSALSPIKLLSKASVRERLFIRIDDKLNRLVSGAESDEDTLLDLLGYFILERIDAKRNNANAKQD